jgi:hypothetical protein
MGYRVFIFSHDHPHPPLVHIGKTTDLAVGMCRPANAATKAVSPRRKFESNVNYSMCTATRSSGVGTSTGNAKMKQPKKTDGVRAMGLRSAKERIVVTLKDEREISVPLAWYPTLERAAPAKRSHWILLGDGQGFHWPDLDLDLSVAGLVNGLRESIPRPPAKARTRRRELAAG